MEDRSLAGNRIAIIVVTQVLIFACMMLTMPISAFAVEDITGGTSVSGSGHPTVGSAVSASAGNLTVLIDRTYYDTEGVECQVALDSSFTSQLKTDSSASFKKEFTGLNRGANYYVRAREYLTIDGQLHYTEWSPAVSAKVGIANKKSAIKGTWTIVKSSDASINSKIKYNKRISKKSKATLTFQTNGTIVFKDYNKKKYKLNDSWGTWVALGKKSGQTTISGEKAATIKVKGKKLTIKMGNVTHTCKK